MAAKQPNNVQNLYQCGSCVLPSVTERQPASEHHEALCTQRSVSARVQRNLVFKGQVREGCAGVQPREDTQASCFRAPAGALRGRGQVQVGL